MRTEKRQRRLRTATPCPPDETRKVARKQIGDIVLVGAATRFPGGFSVSQQCPFVSFGSSVICERTRSCA